MLASKLGKLFTFYKSVKPPSILRCYSSSSDVKFLSRGENRAIAYHSIRNEDQQKPGIIFCPGFQSNMQGVKALALEEYCKERGFSYTRFDYQGCGMSSGDIRDVLFTDWKDDLTAILDQVTAGPQILVGSSMGAWLALLVAMLRPHRVHSLMGISAAPDFAQRVFDRFSPQEIAELKEKGETVMHSDEGDYVITQKFLEDIDQYRIMDQDKIPIHAPIRLIHGMRDTLVPYQISIALAEKLASMNVYLILRKKGEHRMSQPEDVALMFEELDYLIKGSQEVKDMAIRSWAAFSVYSHPEYMIKQRKG